VSAPTGQGACPGVAGAGREVPPRSGEARAKAPAGELESPGPHCREKPLSAEGRVPVPQTDTGRLAEEARR
jgi:hypothetical protein